MENIHVFEVRGEIILRPSGNDGAVPVPCVVITTRAYRYDTGEVTFYELTTGHAPYVFPTWFAAWEPGSNYTGPGTDTQVGEEVEVAIPRVAFDEMMRTGKYVMECFVSRSAPLTLTVGRQGRNVRAPLACVKIDGVWTEPL